MLIMILKKICFLISTVSLIFGLQRLTVSAFGDIERIQTNFHVSWNTKFSNIKFIELSLEFVTRDSSRVPLVVKGDLGQVIELGDNKIYDVVQVMVHSCKFTIERYTYWPLTLYTDIATGEIESVSFFEPFNQGMFVDTKLLNDKGELVGNTGVEVFIDERTSAITEIRMNSGSSAIEKLDFKKAPL